MVLRAAVAQIAPDKGQTEFNLNRIASIIRQAADEGAGLICFPETCTTGYFLEGGVLEHAMTADALAEAVGRRLTGSGAIDVVLGFYEKAEATLYNSAAVLRWDGSACHVSSVYRKFFLPTYGVFDEERFVSAGRELGVFEGSWGLGGLLICEDIWHSILGTLLAVYGAQVVVVPSASPARGFDGPTIGNLDRYSRMVRAVSEEHGVFTLNPMLVGFEGGKGFVGGSRIVDPMGQVLAEAPVGEEALIVADLDLDLVAVARTQAPLLADLKTAWSSLRSFVENAPA